MKITSQDYNLEKLDFFELSKIKFEIFSIESQTFGFDEVGVIKFSGDYLSATDAGFMEALIQMTLTYLEPLAIILDLSDLYYKWGDQMIKVIGHNLETQNYTILQATVVGEKCKEAISSLIQFEIGLGDNDYYAITANSIFDNFEDALEYIETKRKTLSELQL